MCDVFRYVRVSCKCYCEFVDFVVDDVHLEVGEDLELFGCY